MYAFPVGTKLSSAQMIPLDLTLPNTRVGETPDRYQTGMNLSRHAILGASSSDYVHSSSLAAVWYTYPVLLTGCYTNPALPDYRRNHSYRVLA